MSSAPNLPQIPSETTPRPTTTGRYKSHPQRDYIKHKEEYRDPYTSRGGHEFDDVEVVDVGFLEVLNWVIFIFIELLIFLVINRYVLLGMVKFAFFLSFSPCTCLFLSSKKTLANVNVTFYW